MTPQQSARCVTFAPNMLGRDLVVGDIHGHFSKLEDALARIKFDPEKDRLFSVGDLIDRGPESHKVLEWLEKPWFHAVCGNHEQMAALWLAEDWPTDNYRVNGGGWLIENPDLNIGWSILALPMLIEVVRKDASFVGIIHANTYHTKWEELRADLNSETHRAEQAQNEMLWGRNRLRGEIETPCIGPAAIFVGHTPTKERKILGNFHFIDNGAWASSRSFALYNIETLEEEK